MKTVLLKTLITALFVISCKTDKQNNTKTKAPQEQSEKASAINNNQKSLKSQLDAKKEASKLKTDPTTKKVFKEGIGSVVKSGVLENALKVGEIAPNFKLSNALGETIDLYTYLKKGKVVLTWYRGGWCPYCNMTLQQLQQELPNFKKNSAQLIALTPELPDKSLSTSEKHDLKFEVLSDVGNKVAKQYGIVFKLTDEVAKIYNQFFSIVDFNGDTSNELPLAATYIIDQDGKIIYAFLDADYRNRAEPSELTEVLEKASTSK
jgi:peroxiredoxin